MPVTAFFVLELKFFRLFIAVTQKQGKLEKLGRQCPGKKKDYVDFKSHPDDSLRTMPTCTCYVKISLLSASLSV